MARCAPAVNINTTANIANTVETTCETNFPFQFIELSLWPTDFLFHFSIFQSLFPEPLSESGAFRRVGITCPFHTLKPSAHLCPIPRNHRCKGRVSRHTTVNFLQRDIPRKTKDGYL